MPSRGHRAQQGRVPHAAAYDEHGPRAEIAVATDASNATDDSTKNYTAARAAHATLAASRSRSTPATTPAAVSALPSLSPRSPLYSISVTELLEMLGPDFDFDLQIERNRYKK